MRKLASVILILSLACVAVLSGGCDKDEISLSEKIEMKVLAYKTDLEDSISTLSTPGKVADYLVHWADSKGIDHKRDKRNNVIMEVETSEAYVTAAPTVVICPYDTAQMRNSIAPLSVGLYLAKNNENTGRLKVIFTDNTGNSFRGLNYLSGDYFTDDSNVFCLCSGSRNIWSMHTGARSSYEFRGNISFTAPTKNKAYKISIENLPGGVPDSAAGSYPNPIKRLGNLLAQFKTNALIYELASFEGGTDGDLYAESASMTVVIEADDFERFQKKVEKDIDDFNDHVLDDFPKATYTCEETEMPAEVFTPESMNGFVSLVYTLLNGVYYRDGEDETLISFTSIGSLKHDASSYVISALANSLSIESLNEIDKNYRLICGLSEVAYKKTGSREGWSGDETSGFAAEVSDAFTEYTGKNLEYEGCVSTAATTSVQSINNKCNIVNLSLNTKELERYTGSILTFMMNQPHEESQKHFKN